MDYGEPEKGNTMTIAKAIEKTGKKTAVKTAEKTAVKKTAVKKTAVKTAEKTVKISSNRTIRDTKRNLQGKVHAASGNGGHVKGQVTYLIGQGRLILSYNPDDKAIIRMLEKVALKGEKAGLSYKNSCKAAIREYAD